MSGPEMPTRASAADRGVRPTVLVAHPYVYPSGGGNSVAAWALQALREEYDVTLATLGPVDYTAVNRSFGTSLKREDFRIRMAPAFWLGVMRSMPTPGALLEQCVTIRWAQNLDREERFDALVSTQNEADFGRLGIHYVHFPWAYLPRPDNEMRWYHRIPGFLNAYRRFCRSVGRASDEGLRRNVSLVNSEFVAGRMRDVHGVESNILYPPVPGGFPFVPWEQRVEGIVALGRMHATKRWETAVEIADRVRSQGIDISLTLISHRDDVEYGARMEALAAARPWFRILYNLPRERMVEEVARHRYGLHTMQNEHFGIAPAELQRAGCITFVHRSGGPMEIVGRREELMFDGAAEGCERICKVVRDADPQRELRRFAAERAECFSEERFCTELRGYVGALVR
jgi:glycosyltransferase involved in cell wall biosynthesis